MSRRTIIVVPCYNEADRLRTEVFCAYVREDQQVGFLFVDDGSTDRTAEVLDELVAGGCGAIEAMSLPRNMGKAEAVRRGLLKAFASGAEYVGFWDADLATPLDEIAPLQNLLDEHPPLEMVFAARVNLLGRSIRRKLLRHYIGRVFATSAVAVIRVPIYDTQCGAKLFRATDAVKDLFREPFISKWIFDVEIVARLVQQRRGTDQPQPREVIREHPLMMWDDVKGSKLKYRDFFVVGMDLLRIHFRYMRK